MPRGRSGSAIGQTNLREWAQRVRVAGDPAQTSTTPLPDSDGHNLRIYFPALVKLLSRYPNGRPECFKKTFPPPSLEPLSHHRCRLSLGPGTRPHVRIAPDLLPQLSRPPRRRLASSWPECGRRLAHGL